MSWSFSSNLLAVDFSEWRFRIAFCCFSFNCLNCCISWEAWTKINMSINDSLATHNSDLVFSWNISWKHQSCFFFHDKFSLFYFSGGNAAQSLAIYFHNLKWFVVAEFFMGLPVWFLAWRIAVICNTTSWTLLQIATLFVAKITGFLRHYWSAKSLSQVLIFTKLRCRFLSLCKHSMILEENL